MGRWVEVPRSACARKRKKLEALLCLAEDKADLCLAMLRRDLSWLLKRTSFSDLGTIWVPSPPALAKKAVTWRLGSRASQF